MVSWGAGQHWPNVISRSSYSAAVQHSSPLVREIHAVELRKPFLPAVADQSLCLPQIHMLKPHPSVAIFGDGTSKEVVIKFMRSYVWGPDPIGIVL